MNLAFSEIYKVSTNGKGLGFFDLKKNQPTKNLPHFKGVYVWGFKFNNGNGQFMPYYVGQAGGGKINSKSRVSDRLFCHFNFNQHYHVINYNYLPIFNTIIKTDEEIDELAKKNFPANHCISIDFKNYKKYFDFLNKEDIPTKYNGKAYKAKYSSGKLNPHKLNPQLSNIQIKNLQTSIKKYQDNFYACWIEYPVSQNSLPLTKQQQKEILEIEKYVHTLVKTKPNQRLIGKDIVLKEKMFKDLKSKYHINNANLSQIDLFI